MQLSHQIVSWGVSLAQCIHESVHLTYDCFVQFFFLVQFLFTFLSETESNSATVKAGFTEKERGYKEIPQSQIPLNIYPMRLLTP